MRKSKSKYIPNHLTVDEIELWKQSPERIEAFYSRLSDFSKAYVKDALNRVDELSKDVARSLPITFTLNFTGAHLNRSGSKIYVESSFTSKIAYATYHCNVLFCEILEELFGSSYHKIPRPEQPFMIACFEPSMGHNPCRLGFHAHCTLILPWRPAAKHTHVTLDALIHRAAKRLLSWPKPVEQIKINDEGGNLKGWLCYSLKFLDKPYHTLESKSDTVELWPRSREAGTAMQQKFMVGSHSSTPSVVERDIKTAHRRQSAGRKQSNLVPVAALVEPVPPLRERLAPATMRRMLNSLAQQFRHEQSQERPPKR